MSAVSPDPLSEGFFRGKLAHACRERASLLCVGLDPDPDRTPARELRGFLRRVWRATREVAGCYKANLAFFEAAGPSGWDALRWLRDLVPLGQPLIGDAKRSDVEHSARWYGRALLDGLGFDAITVNPLLGRDAVEPFLELAGASRGVYLLCRTSNPGAADFLELPVAGEPGQPLRPLYEEVARRAQEWNARGNVGLVVGATAPDQLHRLRLLCPDLSFLVPGVGAQGGDAATAVGAAWGGWWGSLVVNVSRGIIYAGPDEASIAQAAQRYRDEVTSALEL
ncbi:MAG: orotidine-5'-phosphate decarboxylase [Chloroflexi bacterium]|nr:orotidine-5'-phosphate decarboxylase [Chloroflexota bacterium]